jgi:hypothetical protein
LKPAGQNDFYADLTDKTANPHRDFMRAGRIAGSD